MDNLFAEHLLKPVQHPQSDLLRKQGEWVALGLEIDPQADLLRRIERLLKNLGDSIPTDNDAYSKWVNFSQRWAALNVDVNEAVDLPAPIKQSLDSLQSHIDGAFQTWLVKKYSNLYNQPPSPPVMVHHVPKYLARQLGDSLKSRVALVVVDGMSLSQWQVIRHIWETMSPDVVFDEHSIFAWIPTMTSVSRQAIFSGKLPQFFESHIYDTANEENYWRQFWSDEGLNSQQVAFAKAVNDDNLEEVENILSNAKLRVAGLVVDTVDKIMHGEQLGAAGMQNQVQHWATRGFLSELVRRLVDKGFDVWLTADHGNTEAAGLGIPSNEGVLAEEKSKRVRVYNDEKLRARFAQDLVETIEWNGIGLPSSFKCLIATDRKAFISPKQKTVTHGGLTIDEVMVPFISVKTGVIANEQSS